jgi:aminopeptidase N
MRTLLVLMVLGAMAGSVPVTAVDRSCLWRSEEALGYVMPEEFLRDWPRDTLYGYDVGHVDLDLSVNFTPQTIVALSTLTLTITEPNLTALVVDLNQTLTVDGVTVDGLARPFTQQPEQVQITLASSPAVGEELAVGIAYHGRPALVGTKSMRWGTHGASAIPIMYTLSTPYSTSTATTIPISHYWRPCKDVPDDKSTCSMSVTVPEGMLACSNGVMVSNVNNGDGTRTLSWAHDFPIAPYLITVGATNYVTIEDVYVGSGGETAQIQHFVYPEIYNSALTSFNIVPEAMATFAGLFGEYPFMGDKYGMFATLPGPAVEEQTMTAYPSGYINGGHQYDWILVHEMSHMWWGDCVTCRSWDHVWLNEGFASYAEALWREHLGGFAALRAYMLDMDNGPYQGSIYNPPYIWHAIVYEKAGWVVHMLRHVMGDSAFFQFLLDYRAAYEYESVVTDDMIAVAESVYGGDLDWFFEPWLYHQGEPAYEYDWTYCGSGPYQVTLNVKQIQSLAYPTYTMPIDVSILTTSGRVNTAIWDSLRTQWFTVEVEHEPVSLTLDPNNWILTTITEGAAGVDAGETAELVRQSLELRAPNPFRESTTLRFTLSRPGRVALNVFDVDGRMVRSLCHGSFAGGAHEVSWDARDEDGQRVAAGVYFCRLVGPGGTAERRVVLMP